MKQVYNVILYAQEVSDYSIHSSFQWGRGIEVDCWKWNLFSLLLEAVNMFEY